MSCAPREWVGRPAPAHFRFTRAANRAASNEAIKTSYGRSDSSIRDQELLSSRKFRRVGFALHQFGAVHDPGGRVDGAVDARHHGAAAAGAGAPAIARG